LVRRPASVVWTILVLGFYSFITLWKFSQAIASRGLWEVIQTQTPWNLPVLILVSFAVSLLGRGKLSHRVISVIIGWNIIRGVVFSFSNWMKVTDKWQYLLDNSLTFIIAAPLLYLFFRYIFGQPARSYYGYTPHSPCQGHSGAFFPVSPVTFARASSSSPAFPDARRPPMTAYGTRGTNGSVTLTPVNCLTDRVRGVRGPFRVFRMFRRPNHSLDAKAILLPSQPRSFSPISHARPQPLQDRIC